MGSDRARVSYDPNQQYRSVVMQQGRVTLEADWNEAQSIAGEARRLEALDVVGPAGTPDNGYAISPIAGSFDLNIGAGTMYVGGMRCWLPTGLRYSQQQQNDWMDWSNDASWVSVPGATPASNEYACLFLREQEVGAVEDNDLKDVALGGPDTAQRTRLVQHIVRLATTGTDCPSALAAAQTAWASDGFTLNGDRSVSSFARLQVAFVPPSTPATSCDPTAQSGYLGADNQLIRVQVSDPKAAPQCLLWGYDDASFLYAITVESATSVTLQSAPVDAEHIPQAGQVVEILMAAAQLANPQGGQYAAAPTGQIFTLGSSAYDPDTQILNLPSSLDVPLYGDGTSQNPSPKQVFLRVWEGTLPIAPGTSQTLPNTGVQVNLTSTNANNVFRGGDYWMFAVRPALPSLVYPERFAIAPQPPDGPREWICPLAVIGWNGGTGSLLSDCRATFGPLASKALHITGINWPNDDLVSLPAFRNNPLQVTFDFSPSAQSVSDSSMIVVVEVPDLEGRGYNGFQAKPAAVGASSPSTAARSRLTGRDVTSGRGFIGVGKPLPRPLPPGTYVPTGLPNSLLTAYGPLISAVAATSLPSDPSSMLGFTSLIEPGDPTVASGTASWNLQLPPSEFISYLSSLSSSAIGPQLRVRVTLKGRDIFAGSTTPLVYLDGQVFGEPELRADGTTPCTGLLLPSGDGARASDFESWFWLSLFVWGQTSYSIGDLPLCITTADFNKDGAPDIAVATVSGGVYVLLNDGSGTFTVNRADGLAGEWPLSIAAGDFTGGGFVDLAVSSYSNGTVTILPGSATGAFTAAPTSIKVGNGAWALVTADFNGDGKPDLAVTNAQDNTVSILLNGGTGSFAAASGSPLAVGEVPLGLVAVDLTGSGTVDLAVLNAGDNTASLFTGDGHGGFSPATVPTLTLPSDGDDGSGKPYPALPLSMTAADFNQDGLPDLAIGGIYMGAAGSTPNSYVAVFLNNPDSQGAGSFSNFYTETSISGIPGSLTAANLDPTDPAGSIDLVVTGASFLGGIDTFSVLAGDGQGDFEPVQYPVSGNVNAIAVATADFNGDGIPDLAMTTSGAGVLVLLNEQSQIASASVFLNPLPPGPWHVGDSMTATGRSLWGGGSNAVYINFNGALTPVTNFTTQTDSKLVFTIPAVFVPTGGSSVYLLVESLTQGVASAEFTLLPEAITVPTGEIQIQLAAPPATVFNAPSTGVSNYLLSYAISANTDLSDTYSLTPAIDAAGWSAAIFDKTTNQVIPNATVAIAAAASASQNTIVQGNLQISIPAGATGSANLTLTVASLAPAGLTKSSPTAVIPVGGSVLLSSGIGVMPDPAPGNLDANGNLLVPLAGLQLNFFLTVAVAGTYDLTYSFDNSDWTAIVQSSIPIAVANQPATLSTVITPNAGAAPSNFYLTVALSTDTTGTVATKVFYPVVLQS